MGSKVQRIFLIGSLGVGYFLYRNALREVIFQNQNTFLNSTLLSQFQDQNYTVVGQNRVLIGNPINKSYNPSRERIVVLGGGIAGLSTTYYLSKLKKYDVILVEKNEDFLQVPNDINGGVLAPSQCFPQTNGSFFYNGMKSLLLSETPVRFSARVFFERFITIWISNYFYNLVKKSDVQNCEKLAHLAQLGMEEVTALNNEIQLNELCNMTSKGTIRLYSKMKDLEENKSKIEAIKASAISIRELDQDQLIQLEPALRSALEKYEYGYVGSMDTNVDINSFSQKFAQIAEINGAVLFKGAEFHRFLIQKETNKIVGVITSQGVVLCDKVVVASGINTKEMIHKLGVRVPILGLKEYTIAAHIPQNKNLSYNLVDDKTGVFISKFKGKYFISGGNDMGSSTDFIQDKQVQYLVKAARKKVGEFDSTNIDVWSNIRALSADDVPILGPIPNYGNVYLNTGHGNKGLTLALGSGKVLSDIIDGRVKKDTELAYSINRFYLI